MVKQGAVDFDLDGAGAGQPPSSHSDGSQASSHQDSSGSSSKGSDPRAVIFVVISACAMVLVGLAGESWGWVWAGLALAAIVLASRASESGRGWGGRIVDFAKGLIGRIVDFAKGGELAKLLLIASLALTIWGATFIAAPNGKGLAMLRCWALWAFFVAFVASILAWVQGARLKMPDKD